MKDEGTIMTLLMLLALLPTPLATTLTGNWVTPDKSIVQVHACGGNQLCVRVATIAKKDVPRTDSNNPDAALRDRALCGLEIGTAFTPAGADEAKGGKIYDPQSGKTYSAQMQSSGDTLKLHGYLGISLLGRTETWQRVNGAVPACE